jgi:ketosteroid isomerase-like protein
MSIRRLERYAVGLFFILAAGLMPAKAQEAEATAVKAVDQAFYKALSTRDIKAMMAVWADGSYVVNIGPRSKKMDVGSSEVKRYWEGAFDYFSQMNASKTDARIQIVGNVALVIGSETAILQPASGGDPLKFDTFVTHVFEKQGDQWLLVVHHAQMIPK